mgnify:CR=1 FL=1
MKHLGLRRPASTFCDLQPHILLHNAKNGSVVSCSIYFQPSASRHKDIRTVQYMDVKLHVHNTLPPQILIFFVRPFIDKLTSLYRIYLRLGSPRSTSWVVPILSVGQKAYIIKNSKAFI